MLTFVRMHTHTDGWTDGQMERQKLYTPRHTLYAGGIITSDPWGEAIFDPRVII